MSSEDIYRTPDSCFELPSDYDICPNYVEDLPGYASLRRDIVDRVGLMSVRCVIHRVGASGRDGNE